MILYGMLYESDINARFIILNFVDDPTLISTSYNEWHIHFENLFNNLIKTNVLPEGMNLLNLKV